MNQDVTTEQVQEYLDFECSRPYGEERIFQYGLYPYPVNYSENPLDYSHGKSTSVITNSKGVKVFQLINHGEILLNVVNPFLRNDEADLLREKKIEIYGRKYAGELQKAGRDLICISGRATLYILFKAFEKIPLERLWDFIPAIARFLSIGGFYLEGFNIGYSKFRSDRYNFLTENLYCLMRKKKLKSYGWFCDKTALDGFTKSKNSKDKSSLFILLTKYHPIYKNKDHFAKYDNSKTYLDSVADELASFVNSCIAKEEKNKESTEADIGINIELPCQKILERAIENLYSKKIITPIKVQDHKKNYALSNRADSTKRPFVLKGFYTIYDCHLDDLRLYDFLESKEVMRTKERYLFRKEDIKRFILVNPKFSEIIKENDKNIQSYPMHLPSFLKL